ncbi:hypothetical protein G6F24_018709 [Rhizopus arrhizus]|nr:hypothetical protein G6F24_018709 [Rhizopus arrhizus]
MLQNEKSLQQWGLFCCLGFRGARRSRLRLSPDPPAVRGPSSPRHPTGRSRCRPAPPPPAGCGPPRHCRRSAPSRLRSTHRSTIHAPAAARACARG